LKWHESWLGSANDYDLLLIDRNNIPVAWSNNIQAGNQTPVEYLEYTAAYSGKYHLAISTDSNPAPVRFDLYSFNHDLQYATASGSILVPAHSVAAFSVGSVPCSNPAALENFSSCGPALNGVIKPDIVSPDRVSTVCLGPQSFKGTSASAPLVAGAAALIKDCHRGFTPARIQEFLEQQAVDLGEAGKDNLFGSGLLHFENIPANTAPMLSDPVVEPSAGFRQAPVSFTVLYTDADNDPPAFIHIFIDGGNAGLMLPQPGGDGIFSNGELYTFTTQFQQTGMHSFRFSASDRWLEASGDIGMNQGPQILNSAPLMGPLLEPDSRYYSVRPVLQRLVFSDDSSLVDGYYRLDANDWVTLFSDLYAAEWSAMDWILPEFETLSEGKHQLVFHVQDEESGSAEWTWQFYKNTILGDANASGYIDIGDVVKVERIVLEYDFPTAGSDANLDGTTDMSDILRIEWMILGLKY